MDTREIVHRYYELANRGAWDEWCELFAPDHVMDEQLAGRVEGRETLREMMRGFPEMYAEFANEPVHVVVAQGRAAVVSRITALPAATAARKLARRKSRRPLPTSRMSSAVRKFSGARRNRPAWMSVPGKSALVISAPGTSGSVRGVASPVGRNLLMSV